nr:MAG TPA: hypothetical protein [Caudoviricetes sp.]
MFHIFYIIKFSTYFMYRNRVILIVKIPRCLFSYPSFYII